jgi:hypothetical protein
MFSAAERGCYRAVNTDVSALLLWLNKVRHKTYLMEVTTAHRYPVIRKALTGSRKVRLER